MSDQAGKAPLNDPMAEALAEDAAAEAARSAAEAQAATDAAAAQAGEETPPAATAEAGKGEKPEDETKEAAKKGKSPLETVQARLALKIGEAKTANERAAEAERKLAAAEALLAAQGKTAATDGVQAPVLPPSPTGPVPTTGELYTKAQAEELAKQIAYFNDLNAKADQVFNTGKEKFGDWGERLAGLHSLEIMTPQFAEAAMETGAAVDIIHHLGGDLEEAQRIASLPPIRMGIELARLGQQLNAPAKGPAISKAPAPISPVNGHADPAVNLAKLAEGNDMAAWVAERKKAGDKWAR